MHVCRRYMMGDLCMYVRMYLRCRSWTWRFLVRVFWRTHQHKRVESPHAKLCQEEAPLRYAGKILNTHIYK